MDSAGRAVAAQHLQPHSPQRVRPVLFHDIHTVLNGGSEAPPRLGESLVQALASPVAGALAHLVGREEHGGARPRQRFRSGPLLGRVSDDCLAHEPVAEVLAELCAHVGPAGDVQVSGGPVSNSSTASYRSTRS